MVKKLFSVIIGTSLAASLLFVATSLVKPAKAGGAVELTSYKDVEAKMGGKNGFVKFFAPWCGHCKSMKPAWDKLADEYAGSSSVLIADVDCTADSKDLCEQFGVSGYPTIKYFVDGDLKGEDYRGGRDFDSLKGLVEEKLVIHCDPVNPKEGDCSEKEMGYIEKMKGKSNEDRHAQIKRLENMQGDSMKAELKQWLVARLRILKGLNAASGDEL